MVMWEGVEMTTRAAPAGAIPALPVEAAVPTIIPQFHLPAVGAVGVVAATAMATQIAMVRAVLAAAAMVGAAVAAAVAGMTTITAARVVRAHRPRVWVVVEAVMRMMVLPVAPVAQRDCQVVDLILWPLRAQERSPAKVVVRKTPLLTGSARAVEAVVVFMVQRH